MPIIQSKEYYPIIQDVNQVVLSLPPIINGEHSKITLNTRNVFIECTATDMHKAEIVLDTMVTMFSEYCAVKFQIEAVQVTQLDGSSRIFPTLEQRYEVVDAGLVNRKIGIEIDDGHMCNLLKRMGLPSEVVSAGKINVKIPPTRSDILHACDIIEDVAIAYGYNNIARTIPKTNCFSSEVGDHKIVFLLVFKNKTNNNFFIFSKFELNKLTDLLRLELAQSGFTEALTFTLVCRRNRFYYLYFSKLI